MLLAIDVGNSNLKTGLFAGRELLASWQPPPAVTVAAMNMAC